MITTCNNRRELLASGTHTDSNLFWKLRADFAGCMALCGKQMDWGDCH